MYQIRVQEGIKKWSCLLQVLTWQMHLGVQGLWLALEFQGALFALHTSNCIPYKNV